MAPKQKKTAAAEPKARSRSPVKKEEPKKEEPKTEEPKKEEEPKFQEPDAPKDNRAAMKGNIGFDTADTTLNVIPTVGGKVLASITDGGMANLIASARANCGQKSGRYMFETKIIQVTDPSQGRDKASRQLVRIGFSTEKSNIILGADSSCVYFDSEGFCVTEKKKTSTKNGRFAKDQVVAVVLNLDSKSPNANTVALYRDGAACGDPIALPECLQGKPLFAHVAFRGVSLQVHFGPTNLKPLPFVCRMLQSAAASDVTVLASKAPKDGKYEVVMPVAFPDEGTFDWLDAYLEKNPHYVELSDRKIIEWAQASGMWSKPSGGGWKDQRASNDKPTFSFGVQGMDDRSVQRVLASVVPVVPRNYLIMEVRSNLIASERSTILKKFNYSCYKKVARVIMGEPSKEFTDMVQNKLLKAKQAKTDTEWKRKKAEVERKKILIRKQRELSKLRKEAEKKRKAAIDEKKKADAEKKAKEEEEKKAKEIAEGGEASEKKEEEKKEEETKEAEKKEDEKKEDEKKDEPMEESKEESEDEKEVEDPMDAETEPPVEELTDEEKKVLFPAKSVKDLTPQALSASYSKFTTPELDEGFDDIQYEWQQAEGAQEYLKNWILDKKLTTRIEDIRPGKEFTDKNTAFAKLCREWQDKLKAFKATGKKAPAKKADDEDAEETDIYSVDDICDIGDGVPLFENFTFEDWELLKLRFNFCWLVLSFKKDCNDPDRAGVPLDHLGFYYQKYYHTTFSPKTYGVAENSDLLALIKDTVATKDGLVVANLSDDLESLDILVKLTEEQRRERQRRLDAGDETARLKFVPEFVPRPAAAKPEAAAATGAASADHTDGDKGKSWGKGGKGKGGKGKW